MSHIHIDKVGDMAVVECEGRFVRSDEAFRLRDAVTAQGGAHVIVLDLTETRALGGGVVGVLVFLQRWCHDHDIRFKLFNPSRAVRERLEHTNAMSEFHIASLDEMMALLGRRTGTTRWLPEHPAQVKLERGIRQSFYCTRKINCVPPSRWTFPVFELITAAGPAASNESPLMPTTPRLPGLRGVEVAPVEEPESSPPPGPPGFATEGYAEPPPP